MDFYCFLKFFTPKLYRFPHKKMNSTSTFDKYDTIFNFILQFYYKFELLNSKR